MRAPGRAATLLLLLGVAACGEATSSSGGGGDAAITRLRIVARDYRFDPSSLTVSAGANVALTLTNEGTVEHSFTSDVLRASTDADVNDSNTVSFTAPSSAGPIPFHCKYHPTRMTGTLTVVAAPASPSPTASTPRP